MTIFSHPPSEKESFSGLKLTQHTDNVTQRAEYVARDFSDKEQNIIKLICLCHDIGKATTFFQKYILSDETLDKDKIYKNHWITGAYTALYILKKAGYPVQDQTSAFIAIKHHHSSLPNLRDELKKIATNKQLKSIEKEKLDDIEKTPEATEVFNKITELATDIVGLEEDVSPKEIKQFIDTKPVFSLIKENKSSTQQYAQILKLWSTLMFSDKTSLTEISEETLSQNRIHKESIEKHIHSLQDGTDKQIDTIRENARKTIENAISTDPGIYTISLPTGFGKTYSGLTAALKLKEENASSRIIYTLPYTSILDQVDEEIETVFNTTKTSPEYTLHHYLSTTRSEIISPTNYKIPPTQYYDPEQLLAQTWQSEIVLSTFVQLFESLIGPQKQQSLKIPAIQNSTIILDEPQTLPPEWWSIIPTILQLLVEEFNVTVILMTATQPKIIENKTEETPVELSPLNKTETYLKKQNRVEFIKHPSLENTPLTPDEATENLYNSITNNKSTLCICNTTTNSQTLYNKIKQKIPKPTINEIYFEWKEKTTSKTLTEYIQSEYKTLKYYISTLSTRLRPTDRQIILQTLKDLLKTETPTLLISTQVVEAGVDISFETVYRDFSPFESIVQAAGRCNRENKNNTTGQIIIWRLEDRNQNLPSETVYARKTQFNPLKPASETLRRNTNKKIKEPEFIFTLSQKYYNQLHTQNPGSQELKNQLEKCYFKDLQGKQLISQNSIDIITLTKKETQKLHINPANLSKKEQHKLIHNYQENTISIPISNKWYKNKITETIAKHNGIQIGENTYILTNIEDYNIWTDAGLNIYDPEDTENNEKTIL